MENSEKEVNMELDLLEMKRELRPGRRAKELGESGHKELTWIVYM